MAQEMAVTVTGESPLVDAEAPASAPVAKAARTRNDVGFEEERQGAQRGSRRRPRSPLRSNFAETAFWQPHLLTGADGSASIEFTVPDSVTSWNVWVHARHAGPEGGLDPARRRRASRT